MRRKTNFIRTILVILLMISFFRITSFIDFTSNASLQMDFTAYYTAGKVLLSGADIYENQIENSWLLWDGVAVFNHSRFLYPPLTALVFSLFSYFGYSAAKYFWNVLNFVFVLIALIIMMRAFIKKIKVDEFIIAFTVLLNFFPFIAMLERGQVDGINLLLISVAIILTKNRDNFIAGLVLACATLFKLYIILIIPFLFLLKKPKAVYGYLSGLVALILVSAMFTGIDRNIQYVFDEAPRLSQFGESGKDEMKIPSEALSKYFQLSKFSVSIVEGKMYRTEIISFNSKASFLRIFSVLNEKLHLDIPLAVVSFILYSGFFFIVFFLTRRKDLSSEINQIFFWITALVVILLCSNFTWVMNLVWLVPIIILLIVQF